MWAFVCAPSSSNKEFQTILCYRLTTNCSCAFLQHYQLRMFPTSPENDLVWSLVCNSSFSFSFSKKGFKRSFPSSCTMTPDLEMTTSQQAALLRFGALRKMKSFASHLDSHHKQEIWPQQTIVQNCVCIQRLPYLCIITKQQLSTNLIEKSVRTSLQQLPKPLNI